MIRPFLVLATVLTAILGVVAGADAAELFSPIAGPDPQHVTRGPGFYLNLFKFVPVVLIYLLWAWTTDWVEHDTKELNNLKFATWNSVVFFSGRAGPGPGAGDPDLPPRLGAACSWRTSSRC